MTEIRHQALDLEELAAFVDGRLSGPRKARMEELVARDPDAYEIFVETVAFQEEERRQDGDVVVLPRAWRRWSGPLAAAALVVLAVGLLLGRLAGGNLSTPLAAQASAIVATDGWDDLGTSRSRSIPDVDAEVAAFLLGARSVDLGLAVAAAAPDDVRRLVRQISALADKADRTEAFLAYTALGQRLLDGEPLAGLGDSLARAAGYLDGGFTAGSPQAARFRLGEWTEVGRLAVRAGDTGTLRGRRFRAVLQELRDAPPAPRIGEDLAAIAAVLEGGELTPADLEALAEAFARVVAAAG